MKITISFNTDNDSFQGDDFYNQLEVLLKQAYIKITENSMLNQLLIDINGNSVGTIKKTLSRKRKK